MRVTTFTVGSFQVNTYLLTDEATGASAVVDTGESDELPRRLLALDPQPDIQMILLTHAHLDHAGALPALQAAYDVPTYLPRKELPLFETLPVQAQMFGIPMPPAECGRTDHLVDDGDTIQLACDPGPAPAAPAPTAPVPTTAAPPQPAKRSRAVVVLPLLGGGSGSLSHRSRTLRCATRSCR